MDWAVETLNATVDKELDALPAGMRARFVRLCELIAAVGLDRVGAPHVRHLTGPLWEMRLRGSGRHIACVVRCRPGEKGRGGAGLIKKARKTPRREIDLALRRAREVLE